MALPNSSLGYALTSTGANTAIVTNWEIVDVTPPGSEVDDINTSHQGTTTEHTHKAAPLKENDDLSLECHDDPLNRPVVGAANETWTLTCTDAATTDLAFPGYVQSHKPASHVLNGKTMMTIVLKVAGAVTVT